MNYVIWSNEHAAWWRPFRNGYTANVFQAGRYTRAEALEICQSTMLREPPAKYDLPVPADDVCEMLERDCREAP